MTKKSRRKRSVPSPKVPTRVPGLRTGIRQAFDLIDEVGKEADRCIPRAEVDAESGHVIAAIFVRGVNCVKSVRAQLEHAHWETAAGTSRQLFELLLNSEFIISSDNREEAAFRYASSAYFRRSCICARRSPTTRRPVGRSTATASPSSMASCPDQPSRSSVIQGLMTDGRRRGLASQHGSWRCCPRVHSDGTSTT